jgi:hypothetical protein
VYRKLLGLSVHNSRSSGARGNRKYLDRFGEESGKLFIKNCYESLITEGIMPNGRTNKMADLQETKFLRLSGLTNVHY